MAKNPTYSDYVSSNDFEGAKERFDNANKRWKTHWFEACEEIFNACKDWAKKYILDKINKVILVIGEFITKKRPKEEGTSNTYLIKMFDEAGNWVFTKIGKANVIAKRMQGLLKHEYKRGGTVKISNIEIVKSYQLPNDDLAQVLENLMRHYFRKTRKFIPNDRFEAFEPTAEDLQVFENNYNLVMANAQGEVEIPLSFLCILPIDISPARDGTPRAEFQIFPAFTNFSSKIQL